jgi:hypothetical protein
MGHVDELDAYFPTELVDVGVPVGPGPPEGETSSILHSFVNPRASSIMILLWTNRRSLLSALVCQHHPYYFRGLGIPNVS